MTASAIKPAEIVLHASAHDHRIAAYAAAAIAITIAEAALPSPLPGVKPGLANIIVLVVLLRHGWRDAVWVSLLRVIAASLVGGTFLAPGFVMSLAGALCSLGILGLSTRLPAKWFGPVSNSVLAAFAHIGGQILVARLWLVPHDGVFYLLPVFALAALVFGVVNGLVAGQIMSAHSVLPAPTGEIAPLPQSLSR
ncbi:MAG: Gx transporter family protein [Rhodocyclaceae bacterium]|nr:Gx transporter family protein [Rhodocyclaceae bacterium]